MYTKVQQCELTIKCLESSKYVGLTNMNMCHMCPYLGAVMYASRITYCPLVNHGKYADGTDKLMDRWQAITLHFQLDAANIIKQ